MEKGKVILLEWSFRVSKRKIWGIEVWVFVVG